MFYSYDYVFDGLNYWINGIASTASSAWSYAQNAYSYAVSAWNAIPSYWTIRGWITDALGFDISWFSDRYSRMTFLFDTAWDDIHSFLRDPSSYIISKLKLKGDELADFLADYVVIILDKLYEHERVG